MEGKMEHWSLPVEEKHFDNALEVVRGLYDIKRTGWIKRGVENPETVGEHTDALIAIGEEVCDKVPELDRTKLLRMLQIHDWPEVIVGDMVTATVTADQRQKVEAEKFSKELEAMKKICANLGEEGEKNLALWMEYEEGKTAEGSMSKQIDKLQAMIKAHEYEQAGQGTVTAKEFINHARHKITHPVLLEMLARIDV